MKGYYAGITSGDSLYYYTDSAGIVRYKIQSFSWPDSLVVTSPDSVSIAIASKFYNITFGYGDSLTLFDSVSYLQNYTLGQSGNIVYNAVLIDTANNINHIGVTIAYGYNKNITSNFALYKRQ